MAAPIIKLKHPETVLFEIGPEKHKFFISAELLKASNCYNDTQEAIDMERPELCTVAAFGVFVNWLHSKTVLIPLKAEKGEDTADSWVFLTRCWQVADVVESTAYRHALVLAMMNFSKSSKDNFPLAETQKRMQSIVSGTDSSEFWEAVADCLLYHWTSKEDWTDFDDYQATATMAQCVARRLAHMTDLKPARKDKFLWDDWK